MIITVTMNPAVDRTVWLDHLEKGGLNRILSKKTDVGGKGINVSKTIHTLGLKSIATGLIGGKSGRMIERVLQEQGIQTDFVKIEGNNRINTKVAETDGSVTELNELGPHISEEELNDLLQKLDQYANEDTMFVFSGSVPDGVPEEFYELAIKMVHQKGAKVFLDADRMLLKRGLKAKPDFLKVNQQELETLFGTKVSDVKEAAILGMRLLDEGVGFAVLSLGSEGAVFISQNFCVRCPGLKVPIVSTVGTGDGMVGALASSWEEGISFEAGIRLAMAVSAATVTTQGTRPADQMMVMKLYQKVKFEQIQ